MKILFITSLLGKNYGGAEISTGLLLDSLTAKGHEVKALTTRKVQADNHLVSISFPVEIPKKMLTLGNSQIDYFLAKKIKSQIKQINPDVIHVQDTYILPATVIANKNLGVPSVATIRNSVLDKTWDLMFPFPISTILKRRNKKIINALHKIDRVISVSHYTKNELMERGIEGEKIFPIYNLPPTLKEPQKPDSERSDSRVHLLAPGFIASFKGFSVLIKAMNHVSEQEKNVRLTITGDGPERKSLQKMTQRLDLEPYVKFAGKFSFPDLFQFYSRCDIVVLPSIYPEPFGRVALEAMFFGKAVVASKVGGIPEIIEDQKTGLLVPPNDPASLAESIVRLIRDSQMRKNMGHSGQELTQTKFNPDRIVNQTLGLYEQAISSRQH